MPLNSLKEFTHRLSSFTNRPNKALIHSIEGDIYLLEIQNLQNTKKYKPKKFKSLALAKRHAKEMKITEVELAINDAYDQMIGI